MPTPYAEPAVADEQTWLLQTQISAVSGAVNRAAAIAANRVQGTKAAGSTIAAGGTAVTATITPRFTGKVRVTVCVNGSIDAPINPLLEQLVGITTTKIGSWPATSSGSWVSLSFVLDVSGLTLGVPATFKVVTTLGDGNLTIGNGTDGVGAAIVVEELS